MPTLAKLVDPARWRAVIRRALENRRQQRLDRRLDAAWARRGPATVSAPDKPTVIADGMWYNPNHFMRLRLFIEALALQGEYHLLGVLRNRGDVRARRALERIGFIDFVYLDEHPEFSTASFLAAADRLLADVTTHADFLRLDLPDGLPAYVVYDTVLKAAQSPQPPLTLPLWRQALAEALRDIAIYRRELDSRTVAHVALSHPWKTEWASLMWLALGRGVTAYHLTGFVEALRIRRFRSREDFRNPVESLPCADFRRLPAGTRATLAQIGAEQLERRASAKTSDINARYAYHPESRIVDRSAARTALGGDDRPIAVIYSHVWYDFPHTFGMSQFTDFRDWMETTLANIRDISDVLWLIKPHPTEEWYGGFRLADIATDLPSHVRLLSSAVDNKTVLTAADCVVTVHGTVGLEAAASGLPVILADRSYFSDWGFAHAATDRQDYLRLLAEAGRLKPPSTEQRDMARAAFALSLAQPPAELGALAMICDSQGALAYEEVLRRADEPAGSALASERGRIADFLRQDAFDSFAAYHLIKLAGSVTPAAGESTVPTTAARQENFHR